MKKYLLTGLTGIAIVAIFLAGCAEKPQDSLWSMQPTYQQKPDPTIQAVEPATAYAGITEVTITGTNFDPSDNNTHTRVYFGGVKSKIVSVTETEIHCIAPIITGDSLIVKVQVDGALLFGESNPYKIQSAEKEYGGVTENTDAYGLAADLDGNLYVSSGSGKILKITPDEEQVDYVITADEVSGAPFYFKTMKMGPGKVLYAGRTAYLYQYNEDGTYSRVRLNKTITDFDFDENLNVYYSTKFAIYAADGRNLADRTDRLVADYSDYIVGSLRVFNGYVYVAASFNGVNSDTIQRGVWRNEILNAAGDLGPNELVFSWDAYYSGQEVGIPSILSLTFSEDGDMYLGADSTVISDAITVVHPDGNGAYLPENAEPLYRDVLMPPATTFCWGNSEYLYVNRRSIGNANKRVIRVTMGKNSAPYYGRR